MTGVVVAGIGTGIGKTLVAAIITEALQADYWKPVQAGNLDFTDTDFVKQHNSNTKTFFHPEAYRLATPMSPHAAAKIDGVIIELEKLTIPESVNAVVIELAGGLMVPLNDERLNIDLLKQWSLPVVLVSQNYLGSINHTLLSVEVLKHHAIRLAGIIFNGEPNAATEDFILQYTGVNCIARIDHEKIISKETVKRYADKFREKLNGL
ncbi:dethiobiotin synthase [Terrimonas pollutisoli]|uniref:dethiobiotin synthase n=1 Tax=Terrimonas pollutisoli TaxID=3034147 RepID=UPI0023EC94DB|nr:dethiobiotin synthase [Terrimonas sp. H1YJ31]